MAITQQTLAFLGENRLRDSRDWFVENRHSYKALVEEPLLKLAEEIGPAIRQIDPLMTTEPRRTLSRIRRDTRFSKDKTTYREAMWLVFRRGKGMEYPAYFFEFSPVSFRYGCGYYAAPPKVMETLRQWVLNGDVRYKRAQKAVDTLPQFCIEGETYKRPRHPNAPPKQREWLERRGISLLCNCKDEELLFSDSLGAALADAYLKMAPVYQLFLEAHLQFAEMPPAAE